MEEKKPAKRKQHVTTFRMAEQVRNIWCATTEAGVSVEDALEDGYFQHVAKQIRPFDRIELRCEDASYFAELIALPVVVQGVPFIRYEVLRKHVFAEPAAPVEIDTEPVDAGEYVIAWAGPRARFRISRKDKSVLKDGFESKGGAERFLAEYLQSVVA